MIHHYLAAVAQINASMVDSRKNESNPKHNCNGVGIASLEPKREDELFQNSIDQSALQQDMHCFEYNTPTCPCYQQVSETSSQ